MYSYFSLLVAKVELATNIALATIGFKVQGL